ncbi:putative 50S ribosomal protein L25 [Oscillibacter valericigenes Sjm18-20]|nr:putative 50S ribosomal protein L25 [Oscillibacter valericigenes Sjm18-20]
MDTIKAEMRNPAAKAKQLRRAGIIPCVIGGVGLKESLLIQIDQNTARQLKRTKRDGSKVDIQVDGKIYHTLIKDLEYNSLNDSIVHICFHVLDAGKKVNSVADIMLFNKDKVQGVLEQIQLKVPHAAKPEYLLDTVTIDLAGIPIGTTLTIGDIPEFQSDKIELQVDPGSIVLRIRDKKRAGERPSEENTEAGE